MNPTMRCREISRGTCDPLLVCAKDGSHERAKAAMCEVNCMFGITVTEKSGHGPEHFVIMHEGRRIGIVNAK
jgi:hypothetical protein